MVAAHCFFSLIEGIKLSKSPALTEGTRIDSEREFHNKRFTEEVRQPTHRFYHAVGPAFDRYHRRMRELSHGKDVLEYGCSVGTKSLGLASVASSITGIDLSDVAIAKAQASAHEGRIANANFIAMNAEAMTFERASFDFVFGSSILHHLDLKASYKGIADVLRPSGTALFLEPLGHNPAINAYRNRTPEFRTPDEHPLLRKDFDLAKNYFSDCNIRLYGLTTLAAIPFLKYSLAGSAAMQLGRVVDSVILSLPAVRWLAWFSVIELKK